MPFLSVSPDDSWLSRWRDRTTRSFGIVAGLGPVSRKSRELIGRDKYIFKCFFFADYTLITDMVLGQSFHRYIRF